MNIGIDDINLAATDRCIELQELVDSGRRTRTDLSKVGFARRSVLNVWQDPVTLAAEAASPIVEDPEAIGLLLIGTETGLDYSKPISSYVHRLLELGPHCRNAEVKHACYGQTMALRLACAWVRENPTRKALVIGTDICRPQDGPSELIAGLGAVALTVCAEPRVLHMDTVSGCAAVETWDVARPTRTREVADPMLSLCSYLDAVETAWEDLHRASGLEWEQLEYVLYHCPSIPLVRQAHALLSSGRDDFSERVEPGVALNRETANIYSASLYVSLLGLLEVKDVNPGVRIGLFSYGSGGCAEFWTGRVGDQAARVRRHGVLAMIAARRSCSIADWLEADEAIAHQLTASDLDLSGMGRPGTIALERIVGWHRIYRRY
jgi:3-hydroxy-3-methylglutaryl CoA synthase